MTNITRTLTLDAHEVLLVTESLRHYLAEFILEASDGTYLCGECVGEGATLKTIVHSDGCDVAPVIALLERFQAVRRGQVFLHATVRISRAQPRPLYHSRPCRQQQHAACDADGCFCPCHETEHDHVFEGNGLSGQASGPDPERAVVDSPGDRSGEHNN